MSNRLFQGVIHQMRDATDRIIGVIDDSGVVVACSELGKIGETRIGVREELSYNNDTVVVDGYTYRSLGQGAKLDNVVFVEGDDKS
ncbi:MAG: PucR family transcriptional regulator, partial [Clostridia bacterium]|nr:PucR family transcriptional regulator [Clostridia bacterium]